MTTCSKCGRPAWKPHGGMGGSIMPDDETHCLRTDARSCRTARAGFVAGLARGVEIAKENAYVPMRVDAIEWQDVDREAAKLAGENGE